MEIGGLGAYGGSYFTSDRLKPGYEKYYDIYEPGDQEKQGGTYYATGINTLWEGDNSVENNTIRKSLSDATYAKMVSRKGDALYEISDGVSYYGKVLINCYAWLKNAADTDPNYSTGWNNDYQLIGHGGRPWVMRGGGFNSDISGGVFEVETYYGYASNMSQGFRPVLVTGASL
jgi:hypothetical protein